MSSVKLDPTRDTGQETSFEISIATPAEVEDLLQFFARDPAANLFHLGVLEEHGVAGEGRGSYRYWIARNRLGIRACAFVSDSGMASAAGEMAAAAALGRALARRMRMRLVVGEREASDALWAVCGTSRPRIYREHRLFVCDGLDDDGDTAGELRLAAERETNDLVRLAAAMRLEELGRSVGTAELEEFAARVAARISDDRIYVLPHGRRLVFKADVGSRCRYGAQIEGVYVVPDQRRQGLAGRCVREMARRLLEHWPCITLHVHERNQPAIRAYLRAGFKPATAFRLILAD